MAARGTLRRRRDEEEKTQREPTTPELSPESRRGIVVILLGLCAVLLMLSYADLASDIGKALERFTTLAFGWWQYVLPVLFIFLAFAASKAARFPWTVRAWIGLGLFVLSSTALLSIFLETTEQHDPVSGLGGGAVGFVLARPLTAFLGAWAGFFVLLAVFLIALLLFFNTTLQALAARGSSVWRFFAALSGGIGEMKIRWQEWRARRDEEQERMQDFERRKIDPAALTEKDEPESEPGESAPTPETNESPEETTADSSAAATQARMPLMLRRRKKSRQVHFPLELLSRISERPTAGNVEENKRIILGTLKNFGIEVEMGDVSIGPTVTQYTLKPAEGVKVSQITTLANDLALALAAHPIRIEAPIPGKSLVGIEVPNRQSALVPLREVLEMEESQKHPSPLALAIGKDVAGSPWVLDLDKLPHLLIAGATGSGKSVMINTVIMNLLYRNSPDDLKLILVDPKRVELTLYDGIPHLLTPVITETNKTINALRWVVAEMDRRYIQLSEARKRNIAGFRAAGFDMPYIVVIIDELADLMAVAANEVEGAIVRLAQMARAVGIHLVVATQRPSVNVITGLIKANITARMAFTVASSIDARTILDASGAEKLLGRGDLLLVTAELSKPKRLQGAFVAEEEIERVAGALRNSAAAEYDLDIIEKAQAPQTVLHGTPEVTGAEDEPMLPEAKRVILSAGKASASLLQRRLSIGYARAARILDILEEQGIIGPADGAKPREILRDLEDEEAEEVFLEDEEQEEEPQPDAEEPEEQDIEETTTEDDRTERDVPEADQKEGPEEKQEDNPELKEEQERYDRWTRS